MTPLAVSVGGGHTRYLQAIADRVEAYLRYKPTVFRSLALRQCGETTETILGRAVLELGEAETGEEVAEVVAILGERGVVP